MGLSELLGGTVVGGYQQAQQLANQKRAADMQNTVQGVGLLAKLQQQQQMGQLQNVIRQAGGDPQKAMQALLSVGTPRAIELATHLKGLLPKPAEPFSLRPDEIRFDPSGREIARGQQMAVRGQPIGSGGLRLDDGTVIPPAARPESKTLVNPKFPVSDDKEQPHYSTDGGVTWTPVPGSNPVARFAKQIPPSFIVPRQPHAVVGVNEEGNQQVTWVKPGENTVLPTKPPSLTTSGNQQAIRLRGEYNANPEVKLANMLEPRVRPTAEYVASVGKGMGNPVGDAELVKLWLMTTHPKGDQIGQMDYRQIQALPDLFGRIKNIAGNFAFGKTLDADTRADMWRSISGKFKATDEVRQRVKEDVKRRANTMGVKEEAIFSQEQ